MDSHFVKNELFHTPGIKALLDDYLYLAEALIASYEVTGESSYLNNAEDIMKLCLEKFWDQDTGGFFDTGEEVLGVRLKGIEDIPHPSANSLGIMLLLKLYHLTQNKKYQDYAERALKYFSTLTKDMVIHSGYYFCALDAYFQMLKLTMQTAPESQLAETALSSFRPYISIAYEDDKACVIPCLKDVCYEPLLSPDAVRDFLLHH
jgi:uncharacterized protein YyaL (SSP411 family)